MANGAKASRTGQFGIRSKATVEMTAPPSMYGIRLPKRVQVPSENIPTMGWMTMPARGAASQK